MVRCVAGYRISASQYALPWGELRMTVDNPSAAIQFEPGKQYYLDFTEAA
jgi:hypothetical protein